MKVHVGVDPGLRGAITLFTEEEHKIFLIPLISEGFVDRQELYNLFSYIKGLGDVHICIESVHAIFGSAAGSTFKFGHVCGMTEMSIVGNRIPFTMVTPKEWQKEMWKGIPEIRKPSSSPTKKGVMDTKAMSLAAVKRLFPDIKLTPPNSIRATKPHDGIVDSILIAEYSRRKF